MTDMPGVLNETQQPAVALDDVRRARTRIEPYIRYTPLMHARLPNAAGELASVMLKMENLQVTGSFKIRGALNAAACFLEQGACAGIAIGAGGNYGPAVARAGRLLGLPTLVVVPAHASRHKIEHLESEGALVVVGGRTFDEFTEQAREFASARGWAYLTPFGNEASMAGHGTIALEVLEAAPDLDVLVVPIGTGALAAGIGVAVKSLRPHVRVVGVEESWSPRLTESLRAGRTVDLPPFQTEAEVQFPRRTSEFNFAYVRQFVDEIVVADDDEIAEAAHMLWEEVEIRATRSAAAAVAAIVSGKVSVTSDQHVCALVCGRGAAGLF
jgi:threonine dehydratase